MANKGIQCCSGLQTAYVPDVEYSGIEMGPVRTAAPPKSNYDAGSW